MEIKSYTPPERSTLAIIRPHRIYVKIGRPRSCPTSLYRVAEFIYPAEFSLLHYGRIVVLHLFILHVSEYWPQGFTIIAVKMLLIHDRVGALPKFEVIRTSK